MTVIAEDFASFLGTVAADTEALIARLLADAPIDGERARPQRLLDVMRYASLNGGKRFRPFLVVASAALFRVPRKRALMVGAALAGSGRISAFDACNPSIRPEWSQPS